MPRVALHTLGCKVNQYETEKIAEGFIAKGFELVNFSDRADIYVINTCTVTQVADGKSRQMVRSAIQRSPDARVVVTGCFAETSPEQARGIEGVSLVVGNQEKDSLVDMVMALLPESCIPVPVRENAHIRTRTRALLKIQDGCNQFCSYCAVPLARSNMYSKPFADVISEASDLAKLGYKEIVLTGIRLGLYCDENADLVSLVDALSNVSGIERIRLSSIELTDIRPGLLELMEHNNRICRHLHIPLQSGDDETQRMMNRPYTASEFTAFVRRARDLVPGIAITTDIMVGFPGETDQRFETSYRLAEEIAFARMHVFRYSPRPGTVAADMPGAVASVEKERRSARLIELGVRHSDEFARKLIGQTVGVLVESKPTPDGKSSGFTDNYVRTVFAGGSEHIGEIVGVEVDSVSGGVAFGRVADAD